MPLQLLLVLLAEHLDDRSHVLDARIDHPSEEAGDHVELPVMWVAHPSLDLNSIGVLLFKVLSDVVHNDSLREVTAQAGQVLQVDSFICDQSVLAVESVEDKVVLGVQNVEDEVGIVLAGCCENHNFVVRMG